MPSGRLRAELRRYGPPAALLFAATLAVLLLRPAIHPGKAAPAPPRPAVVSHPRPKRPPFRRYAIVQAGDTLGAIAARRRTTVARLLALNPVIDAAALHVGQRVRVR
ncbi:MAG: LysM domain-containing protein [Gaiellaceae bacterium]